MQGREYPAAISCANLLEFLARPGQVLTLFGSVLATSSLLTLFPEYFSSFPRGTFLLLDSRRYLAFDGIYHRIWAAFSSNPTRRQRPVEAQKAGVDGVFTLSDVPFQGTWARAAPGIASLDYNSGNEVP